MRLGQILIAAGIITTHELRVSLKYQDEHPEMTLGSVLIMLGFAQREAIEKAVVQHSIMANPDKRVDFDALLELVDDVTSRNRDLAMSAEFISQLIKNRF